MFTTFERGAREFRNAWSLWCQSRTLLAVPLLREGVAIGAILIRRFKIPSVFGSAKSLS